MTSPGTGLANAKLERRSKDASHTAGYDISDTLGAEC
jgi:hypothetical protein